MPHYDDLEQQLMEELHWLDIGRSRDPHDKSFSFFKEIGPVTLICSRAIQKLYSKSSRIATHHTVLATVKELNEELRQLYDTRDPDAQPPGAISNSDALVWVTRFGFKILYFHAVILVNQSLNLHAAVETSANTEVPGFAGCTEADRNAPFNAAKACVDAALSLVELTQDAPQRDTFGLLLV